jgi:hypothetical protein
VIGGAGAPALRVVDALPRSRGETDARPTLVLGGRTYGLPYVRALELDFGRRLDRRPVLAELLRALTCRTILTRAAWPRAVWDQVAWNVRCFDPNVVDVRRLPDARRFAGELAARIAPIPVFATGDGEAQSDSSWRRYDPTARVSVVLPVYNGARYLRGALRSCLEQSHAALEVIVVDDRSTDETPAILAEAAAQDRRVVVVRNETNLRLPGALNVGFARATGDLVTWTSHDNYYEPTAIEVLARTLHTWPDVDFVYSSYWAVDEDDRVDPAVVRAPPPWRLRTHNPIGACFLYRRAVYEAVGDFRRDLEYVEDYEYWIRVYKRFSMMRLHQPLYYYRRHEDSMTTRARDKYDALHRRIRMEHFGHP